MDNPRPKKRCRWASGIIGEGVIPPRAAPGTAGTGSLVGLYYRKCKTDRFAEWRRGNYDWKWKDRRAQVNAIVHPKPGPWSMWELQPPDDDIDVDFDIFTGTEVAGEGDEREKESKRNRRAQESLVDRFRVAGFDKMELLRREGEDLTFRFSLKDTTGCTQSVIVRMNAGKGRQEEGAILQRLAGARHVQQRATISTAPDPSIPAVLPPKLPGMHDRSNARGKFDAHGSIVILEDAKLQGDLGAWLARLSLLNWGKPMSERERPPEKVLWSILYCLWRACVGMAYPRRQAGNGPGGAKAPVPEQPEDIPKGRSKQVAPTDPVVHFNLRPSNVLIGQFDDGVGHAAFPLLKVSDFTRAAFPKSKVFEFLENGEESEAESYLWELRERGEQDSFLPEQTSEAWDYMPNLAALRTSFLAANYGSNSNIFHVGLIMQQIVTCTNPPKPFFARKYAIVETEDDVEKTATGWTYGHVLLSQYEDWSINDEGAVWPSEELRNTIARCMEYVPSRRLGLKRLGRRIARARRALDAEPVEDPDGEGEMGDDGMLDDDEIRQWSEWSLTNAPAQSDPVPFDEIL